MIYKYRNSKRKTVIVNTLETPFPESDEEYDLCVCHYTQALIPRNESIVLGAVIPQVSASFACHPLAKPARTKSVMAFNECEQNCNTCRHLERVEHPKDKHGFMSGVCGNDKGFPSQNPYYEENPSRQMKFHPDDWMGMPCYEARL